VEAKKEIKVETKMETKPAGEKDGENISRSICFNFYREGTTMNFIFKNHVQIIMINTSQCCKKEILTNLFLINFLFYSKQYEIYDMMIIVLFRATFV